MKLKIQFEVAIHIVGAKCGRKEISLEPSGAEVTVLDTLDNVILCRIMPAIDDKILIFDAYWTQFSKLF